MKKLILLSLIVTYNILIMSSESSNDSVTQSNKNFLSRNTFSEDDMQKFDEIISQMEAVKEPELKANLEGAIINFKFIKEQIQANATKISDEVKGYILANLKLKDNNDLQNLSEDDLIDFRDNAYQIDAILARTNDGAGIEDFAKNLFIEYLKSLNLEPTKYDNLVQDKQFMEGIINPIETEPTIDSFENMALPFDNLFSNENRQNLIKEKSGLDWETLLLSSINKELSQKYSTIDKILVGFRVRFQKNFSEPLPDDFAKKLTESLLSFDINDINLIINTLRLTNTIERYQEKPGKIITIINLFSKESFTNLLTNEKVNLIKNVLDILKQPNLEQIAASNNYEDCYEYAEALTDKNTTIKPEDANVYANLFTIAGIRDINLKNLSQPSFVENTLRKNYFNDRSTAIYRQNSTITWPQIQEAVKQAVTKLNVTIDNDKNPLLVDIYKSLDATQKQNFLKKLFQSQFDNVYQGKSKTTSFTDSQVINALETSGIPQGFIRKSLAKWLPDGMFAKLVKTFSILDPLGQKANNEPQSPRIIMPLKPIEIPENPTTDPEAGQGTDY